MLTSVILSIALSTTPAPTAEQNTLDTQKTATAKHLVRIEEKKLDVNKTASKRGRY